MLANAAAVDTVLAPLVHFMISTGSRKVYLSTISLITSVGSPSSSLRPHAVRINSRTASAISMLFFLEVLTSSVTSCAGNFIERVNGVLKSY